MYRRYRWCVFLFVLACACEAQPVESERVLQALDGGADGGDAGVEEEDLGPAPAGPERVTRGLLTLWRFDEAGQGLESDDGRVSLSLEQRPDPEATADMLAEMTATAEGVSAVSGGYYLEQVPAELYDAMTDSDGFTVEVWAQTADDTQTGPARIFTLSQSSSLRNLTIGQQGENLSVRLRHAGTSPDPMEPEPFLNGLPDLQVPGAFGGMRHLVVTFDGYVLRAWSGETSRSVARPEGLGNWDSAFGMAVFNEFEDSRQFAGTVALVAIYDRALTSDEIRQNRIAGPQGGQP